MSFFKKVNIDMKVNDDENINIQNYEKDSNPTFSLLESIKHLQNERKILLGQVQSLEDAIDEETSDDLLQRIANELQKQNGALIAQCNLCGSIMAAKHDMLKVGSFEDCKTNEVALDWAPPLGPPPNKVTVFALNGIYWVSYEYKSNLGIIAYEARAQDISEKGGWHKKGYRLTGGPLTESAWEAPIETLDIHRDPSMVVGQIRVKFEDGSWSNWSKQAKVDGAASTMTTSSDDTDTKKKFIMIDVQVPVAKMFFHGMPALQNNVEIQSMQLCKMDNDVSYYILQPITIALNGIWIAVGGAGGGPGPNGAFGPYCLYTRLAQKLAKYGIATILPIYSSENDGSIHLSSSCKILKCCLNQMLPNILSNFQNGDAAPIVLTGWSMGGAVVLEVAAEAIQKGFQINGVATVASQTAGLQHGSLKASAQFLGMQIPLLLLHGSKDTCLVPLCSEQIFAWSGGAKGTAELKILDGNDHGCFDADFHVESFIKSICKK
jgi:hypothetical protein